LRFTTNSDWTLVTGQNCKRCVTRAFNITKSTSAKNGSYVLPENYVGPLKYAGNTYKDTVCVGNKGDPCVNDFEFFLISNDTEQGSVLQKCDGIMGLAPDEEDNGPSYMTSLRNISLIDKLQISFQMTSMNKKKSVMTFGGYDQSQLQPYPSASNRTIYWYDNMHDDIEWGTQLRNILIDGVSLLDNTTYAKIDSFMPFIQLPIPMYLNYVKYMQANHSLEMECTDQITGFGMCRSINRTCESIMSNFTNLVIRFNDSNAFTVPPSSYLRTETTGSGLSICYNMIIGSALAQDAVILGDTFMENYLVVYDFENTTIGLNGYVIEGLDVEPLRRKNEESSTMIIILISVGVVLAAGAIGAYILVKKRKNILQDKLADYNMLEETKNNSQVYQKPIIMSSGSYIN
jgi:hypothetical protein